MTKSIIWKICYTAVLAIAILTFTPLVTPDNQFEPTLWGIPYTLWVGLLITFILLLITIIGSIVHPGSEDHKTGSGEP